MALVGMNWNRRDDNGYSSYKGTDPGSSGGRHPAVTAQWLQWQRESIAQKVRLAMPLTKDEERIWAELQPRVHTEPANDRAPEMRDELRISEEAPKRRRRRRKKHDKNKSISQQAIEYRNEEHSLFD